MLVLKCVLAFIGSGMFGFIGGIIFPDQKRAPAVAACMSLGTGCLGLLCYLTF